MKALLTILIVSSVAIGVPRYASYGTLTDDLADQFWTSLFDGLSPTARSPTLMQYVEEAKFASMEKSDRY